MIKTINLTKKYKDLVAVDNLNLQVNEGELFSLLGVNGAGKTTALKMLSCLTSPNFGEAFVDGKSILSDEVEIKKVLAISPQESAVANNLTVRENLDFITGIYGYNKLERQGLIDKCLNDLSLTSVADKRASKLSGGYKRRLSIAMAIITNPKVLFLDEPTLGLDVIARSDLWDYIKSLKGKMTIILTTHYLEEAENLSDRVGIMAQGKLVFVGTPSEVKQKGNSDNFEQAFINIVKGVNL